MYTALTIAGSDSSGGAGIQADLKTMTLNGVFAMSAITALTAQNTTGVKSILEATPEFLGDEIDEIFTDIRPDAVKIGMVSSAGLIRVIAERLRFYHAEHIVVDPVMVATSGAKLIDDDAVATLKEELLPLAEVITPNIPETEVLSGMSVRSEEDMRKAAETIANNPNTHGTGCTLSSAIAANLAKGFSLEISVKRAKDYISQALAAGLALGHGHGPMNHAFALPADYAVSADGTIPREFLCGREEERR